MAEQQQELGKKMELKILGKQKRNVEIVKEKKVREAEKNKAK